MNTPVTPEQFLEVVDEKFATIEPQGLIEVILMLGATAFIEDHVSCAACYQDSPQFCPAVKVCKDLKDLATISGHPEWVENAIQED